MPYKSKKQEGWAHTPAGEKALGHKTVEESDQASKGKDLPDSAAEPPPAPSAMPPVATDPAPKDVTPSSKSHFRR